MGIKLFDTAKRSDKTVVEAGTVITVQGRPVNALILLHSGMAELMEFPGDPGERSVEEIIQGSVRVGLIKGESICGVSGFFREEPDRRTIRTLSECQVSVLPITSDGVLTNIQTKKGLPLQVIRATQQCIENAIFLFNNFKVLWHNLASIGDALALADDWTARQPRKPVAPMAAKPDRYLDPLAAYSQGLRNQALKKGLHLPEAWDQNLFLDRLQTEIGSCAEFDPVQVESLIDNPQYLFLKRLVKRSDDVLQPILEKDEPSQYYIFQFFSRTLETILSENRDIAASIRVLAGRIYGKAGWVEEVLALPESRTNPRLANFLHYLWKFSTRCQTDMQKLLDISLTKTYPSLASLARYHEPVAVAIPAEGDGDDSAPAPAPEVSIPQFDAATIAAVKQKYHNLTERILEFSELESPFPEEFKASLAALKALPDKLEGDKAALEVRTKFAEHYWWLYEICFLKLVHSDLKNLIPGIMLHFGLVDETLVKPEELVMIDQAYERSLFIESPIPVMTLPYFLEKIFTGAVNPSMSEMGESFPELLRRQEKMSPKERAAATIFDESPEGKVRYEINAIANPIAKLLSGSRNKSLPVLCSENLTGNVLKIFLDPLGVSEYVDSIRKRDFTLFFREVVLKNRVGNELIRKEVLPNLVLYPAVGSRAMMWQELDGTRKDSAGRFFIPAFFTEKRDETLVELLAFMRWEISRAIAGYAWMDPTEGGLSGAYYDYITYYKKNPDLSPTTKDSLREFINRTRSDRDRFAEDYRSWVVYEYESKVRLNSVARGIFYRFCPFPKDVREQMAKKPMFTDLEVKFQNRTRKDQLAMETRIRRYEKGGEPIPPEVTAMIDMLNG